MHITNIYLYIGQYTVISTCISAVSKSWLGWRLLKFISQRKQIYSIYTEVTSSLYKTGKYVFTWLRPQVRRKRHHTKLWNSGMWNSTQIFWCVLSKFDSVISVHREELLGFTENNHIKIIIVVEVSNLRKLEFVGRKIFRKIYKERLLINQKKSIA